MKINKFFLKEEYKIQNTVKGNKYISIRDIIETVHFTHYIKLESKIKTHMVFNRYLLRSLKT